MYLSSVCVCFSPTPPSTIDFPRAPLTLQAIAAGSPGREVRTCSDLQGAMHGWYLGLKYSWMVALGFMKGKNTIHFF